MAKVTQVNSRKCKDCSNLTKTKNCARCESCKIIYNKEQQKIYRQTKNYKCNPNYKYKIYVSKAAERGYEFNLSFQQFMSFWNKPCYYCNDDIKSIGIDRVNNDSGYTIDNVVPCCTTCNKMKMTMSQSNFINKCICISNLHKKVN